MVGDSVSEMYVRRIEADIRGIRFNTKKPETLNTITVLEKLREVNYGLYEDLLTKYENVKKDYNKRNNDFK
jgi:broad specificity phosphatase PhoE